MADDDYELPSFSLGLDPDSPPLSPNLQPHDPTPDLGGDDEDFRPTDDPPRTLRRLRRGIRRSPPHPTATDKVDDDIEEFSSEEEKGRAEKPSGQYHSLCSSSKLPLYRQSSIVTALSNQLNSTKRKLPSFDAGSAGQQASCSKPLQDFTSKSPIRKFVLVDSDSDDPSITEHPPTEEANKTEVPSKGKTKASFNMPGSEDLWEYFHPMTSSRVSTPALDEVCNEYFLSAKDRTNKNQKPVTYSRPGDDVSCLQPRSSNNIAQNPLPPSHRYFFHNDPRVQNLVRSRLPYFFPLGNGNNEEFKHRDTSVIDYISQFNNGEPSRSQGTEKVVAKKGSQGRGKSKASNAEEPSSVENWVNPGGPATAPKNAGKRRVHANGNSAGRWYTGSDGRKVYVAGNGQELTGSAAYRTHRKESGSGFKKSRKTPKANKKVKR